MVIAIEWAKKYRLVNEKAVLNREKQGKGKVVENSKGKQLQEFEYKMSQSSAARRPDLTLEDKENKEILLCDMACPQEVNIEMKIKEKMDKYQQLAFETREKRMRYKVKIIALVVGCLDGGIGRLLKNVFRVIGDQVKTERTVKEMQKIVLMESETIVEKDSSWNSDIRINSYKNDLPTLQMSRLANFGSLYQWLHKTVAFCTDNNNNNNNNNNNHNMAIWAKRPHWLV